MSSGVCLWEKLCLVALLCSSLVVLPGCMVNPVSLADATIPLERGSYTELGEASGSAFAVLVFGFPLSEPDPAGRARDRAIESQNADALINVSCEAQVYNLMLAIIVVTRVHGTAVKLN